MSNRMQKKLEQINILPNVSIPDLPALTLDIVQSLDLFNLTSKSNFNSTRNVPAKLHQDLTKLFHLNVDIFNVSGKVMQDLENTKQILPNMTWTLPDIFNSSHTTNHKALPNLPTKDPSIMNNLNHSNLSIFDFGKHVQHDFETNMNWTNNFLSTIDFLNVTTNLNATNHHLQNVTKMLLPNLTLPEVQELFSALNLGNISKKIQSDLLPNVTSMNPFSKTNLNATNFNIFNITKNMQQDFESNMNWTHNFLTALDFLNVSTNLNATNMHLQNMTKMLLPNLTLPEVQELFSTLDLGNISRKIQSDLLPNMTAMNPFSLTNLNNTNFNIFNITKNMQQDFESNMNWTHNFLATIDFLNVSTNLNATNLHLQNMTKMLLPNLTFPEVQELFSTFDLLKLNTTIDLMNATKQKVAEIEDQITKSNPIIAQLKAISQEIENSTTYEDIEEVLNTTSYENISEATKFVIARIKDMQNLHPSMKAVVKNIVGPAAYLKNNPVKAQDLKLAMTVLPKILPYILEANTPKLETFLKVGTRFTLGELYQIHKSLVDLHKFVSKLRDGFEDGSSQTLVKMSEMVMEKNIHLMRTILVFMVRADKHDKSLLLEDEDIKELQKYLVSPSDLYSIVLPTN